MYEFQSRVRFSECYPGKKIRLDALFDYMQDCGSFEGTSLDKADDILARDGLSWIVNFWQLDIDRFPRYYEKISIGTIVYNYRNFMGKRNFYFKDSQGKLIIKVNSLWSLINLKEKKLVRISDELASQYEITPALDMEYLPRKILFEKDPSDEKKEPFRVIPLMVDDNQHMNNVQYLRAAQLFIPPGKNIKRIRVEYKKQAFSGDLIIPVIRKQKPYIISMEDEDENPYCIVELTLEE